MSNAFRNVHTFDGTLNNHYTPNENFTKDQKTELLSTFITKLQEQIAKEMIQKIITDLDNENNMDRTNNIDSSNILADICKKVEINEIDMSFIEEQIIDIALLGPCPEGRTTRFLQIWKAIKDC